MTDTDDWFGPESSTFGDRLAAARHKAGLSQKEMAKRLGVKVSTLRSWEDDWSEPRANKLQMVSGLLNVSLPWLLTGEGEGISNPEDTIEMPTDIANIMTEIRDVRSQMVRLTDRLSVLEKRLRAKIQDEIQ